MTAASVFSWPNCPGVWWIKAASTNRSQKHLFLCSSQINVEMSSWAGKLGCPGQSSGSDLQWHFNPGQEQFVPGHNINLHRFHTENLWGFKEPNQIFCQRAPWVRCIFKTSFLHCSAHCHSNTQSNIFLVKDWALMWDRGRLHREGEFPFFLHFRLYHELPRTMAYNSSDLGKKHPENNRAKNS